MYDNLFISIIKINNTINYKNLIEIIQQVLFSVKINATYHNMTNIKINYYHININNKYIIKYTW